MRFAIPLEEGRLARHFGHCELFAFVDVDTASKKISAMTQIEAPEHQPGLLPPWLQRHGVTHVISGGMGSRARELFHDASIEVLTGAPPEGPVTLVEQYLEGSLVTSPNLCDH